MFCSGKKVNRFKRELLVTQEQKANIQNKNKKNEGCTKVFKRRKLEIYLLPLELAKRKCIYL